MKRIECMAIILAGGNGSRLRALTYHIPKPMVHFGSKYRIIDFTLSNCVNSGISPLGILTQYCASEIHNYIGSGDAWNLNKELEVHILPSMTGSPYTGTANAVYQNFAFIEQFQPEHVLILPCDHIYKMDYRKMLDFHKKSDADITISTTSVPLKEASRFGILNTMDNGRITEFWEKPKEPGSTIASMGIYLFKWNQLRKYLIEDAINSNSKHDFGKNVIPSLISSGEKVYAYSYEGYWKDVGTVQSLWESNMDLLSHTFELDFADENWEIFTQSDSSSSRFILDEYQIKNSMISTNCNIYGKVENSVLCDNVTICEGASVTDCVVMPDVFIGKNIKIHKAVIGTGAWVNRSDHSGKKALLIGS